MLLYFKPIFCKKMYVADTIYKIGFELIMRGYVITPVIEISTPKGHMHK